MHNHLLYPRDTYREYILAMRHVARALRRSDLAGVKTWVSIAERLLQMNSRHDAARFAAEKRDAQREEQPHRLKALEQRTRFPR